MSKNKNQIVVSQDNRSINQSAFSHNASMDRKAVSLADLEAKYNPEGREVPLVELHMNNIDIISLEFGTSYSMNEAPFVRIVARWVEGDEIVNFVSFSKPVLKKCVQIKRWGLDNPVRVLVVCSNPHSKRAYFTFEPTNITDDIATELPDNLDYQDIQVFTDEQWRARADDTEENTPF